MSITSLPENLPIPKDDGAAKHLLYSNLPKITLHATNRELINIGSISGCLVLYVYPMTGNPNKPLPDGWDEIPGARGCTPQAWSFRDHFDELQKWKVSLYGLSVQTSEYQIEAKQRLHLPFELLSDETLQLKSAMSLPTFKTLGMELYKRLTLIAVDGEIKKVFYPVFPPDKNADEVISWFDEIICKSI